MSTIPDDNTEYKNKEYWNHRFEQEEEYDWLMPYDDALSKLLVEKGNLKHEHRILIVGCGNSSLSPGLFKDGFTNLVSTDYSQVVIDKMSGKYPEMTWMTMDMLDLKFDGESFDVVIDKCAMDALVVTRKDPWDPEEELMVETGKYLEGVSRVLKPGGVYLQISFDQPHFRKLFLNHPDRYGWTFTHTKFGGGFGYFLYTMVKKNNDSRPLEVEEGK